jgi:hypothetical protein
MHKVVKSLLDAIRKNQEDGMIYVKLADIITRSNITNREQAAYRLNLTSEELEVDLSTNEQSEISIAIFSMLDSDYENHRLVWVASKLHPDTLKEPLQIYILKYGEQVSGVTFYQALIALQNCELVSPSLELRQLLMRRKMTSENIIKSVQTLADFWDITSKA